MQFYFSYIFYIICFTFLFLSQRPKTTQYCYWLTKIGINNWTRITEITNQCHITSPLDCNCIIVITLSLSRSSSVGGVNWQNFVPDYVMRIVTGANALYLFSLLLEPVIYKKKYHWGFLEITEMKCTKTNKILISLDRFRQTGTNKWRKRFWLSKKDDVPSEGSGNVLYQ